MWTRKKLKEDGKRNFKKNYGACVAVCFLIAVLAGGYSVSNSAITSYDETKEISIGVVNTITKENNLHSITNALRINDANNNVETVVNSVSQQHNYIFRFLDAITTFITNNPGIMGAALLLPAVTSLLFMFLFQNVLIVGEANFFIRNKEEKKVLIREILENFRNGNYKNTVIVMLKRYLYLFLWMFTIVGFPIKLYEYRMIPYIIADNPTLTSKEVFKLSKELMYKNKFKTFILDLSFIGWHILTILTLGLLGFLYVNPYIRATDTELYYALKKA